MLQKLITQLGADLGMEDEIGTTEEGGYILPLADDIEVTASEIDKNYLLKGVVGPIPKQNVESFLLRTMEANLFGMGTRGAIIGLNDDGKLLTLSMVLEYNPSFKDFKEKLEDFVSVLDFWRQASANHE